MQLLNNFKEFELGRVWGHEDSVESLAEKLARFVLDDSYNGFKYLNDINEGDKDPIELVLYIRSDGGLDGYALTLTSVSEDEELSYVIVLDAYDAKGHDETIGSFYVDELDIAYDALVQKLF